MRKTGTLLLLICVSFVLVAAAGGCSPWKGTMATPVERDRRLMLGADIQLQQMLDDFDRLLLIDKSSQLMPWYNRVGI